MSDAARQEAERRWGDTLVDPHDYRDLYAREVFEDGAEWQRKQPTEITDAMCWRGQKAWSDYMEHDEMQVVWRGAMRAALEAALNGGTE